MKFKIHKAGPALYAVAIIITLSLYALLFYFCAIGIKNISLKNFFFGLLDEDEWVIEVIKYFGGLASIIVLIITAIQIFFTYYEYNVTALAYDVPITEHQFKELLDFEYECAKKFGLKEVPKLYIDTYSYGEEETIYFKGINIDNKHILRIDAQDIYNSAEEGYYIAKFTIAKKLASISCGQQDFHRLILTLTSKWIPVLNHLRNRVSCYDSDKGAALLLGKEMAIKAIITKTTGFYLAPYLNYGEYEKCLKEVLKEKHVMYENFFLDKPIVAYRLEAIYKDMDGRLF